MLARVSTIVVALWCLGGLAGCEKTTHETIDKWLTTSKGPGKLLKAFANEDLDPELSAHAGVNLIKKQRDPDFRATLEEMSGGRREQVIVALGPSLWNVARVEDPKLLPTHEQTAAKDALVLIRKWAADAQRKAIDGYLLDWYAVRSYEARASAGAYTGATVLRMIGPPAGKRMIAVANSVIAEPGQEKTKNKIHDEVLLGLAVSASPEAVKHVLDIVGLDRGDESLPGRAMAQLYTAYVEPNRLFDVVPPDPLIPNLPQIVAIAKDPLRSGAVINNAIALVRAVGGRTCVEQLVPLIPTPHREAKFKYVAATYALRCGGARAIGEVLRGLPDPGAYEQSEVAGTILAEIAKMSPREEVQAALRPLLDEKSAVVAWVGIEALAAIKSVEDAPKIAALSSRTDRLTGFGGKTSKGDPILGQRAKELAQQLSAR
ncbi:MAG TPA: hypothetical protein VNO30_00310 [Kofleriaceae bacterium]|nr:hypothetical protein [Kofleriaceae bacterium]